MGKPDRFAAVRENVPPKVDFIKAFRWESFQGNLQTVRVIMWEISSGGEPGRFLLVAGRRLNEPVALAGPLVMNTEQEVRQACADYRADGVREV